MKKITIAISLLIPLLPLISKAQLHITSDGIMYASGGTIFYSAENFSNLGTLTIAAGTTVTLNGGSASGAGIIKGSSTSNLSIGGTGTSGSYKFDQTTPGTTNVLKDLTLSGTATATLVNALNIVGGATPGTVIVGSGTTLNTAGFLTLLSNATGTANIGISTGTINGNITVERYIPANGRKFRFLASPLVGGSTLQWRDNAGSTSGRGTQITGPTGTVDASLQNPKSALYYNETLVGGTITDYARWPNIDGNTSLTNGKGYRIFIRGDRTIDLMTAVNSTNNATTIWVNGSYPSNPVTMPITYTAGGGIGWNLVGNPYPCTIDWDLVKAQGSTSDYNNISDAIYIWHPLNTNYNSGGYTSYVSGIGSGTPNVGTRYISSSQAFFVKANGSSPVLKIYESHKVSNDAVYIWHPLNTNYLSGGYTSYVSGIGSGTPNVGTRYISSSQGFMVKATGSSPVLKIYESHKVSAQQGSKIFKNTDEPSHMRLKLSIDTIQFDDAVIHFTEGATKNFDRKYDAFDITQGIGFLTADLKDTLAINGFPKLHVNDVAKIYINNLITGKYKIMFSDMSTFDQTFDAYLIDHYLNKNTLIKEDVIYSFNIDTNNLFTSGGTRFEIIFGESKTSYENILNRKNETQLSVYPNPATDVLNINISNANFKNSKVMITNVSGQQLINTNMIGDNAQLNIESLSNGVYFVTVSNEEGFNKTVKFVK